MSIRTLKRRLLRRVGLLPPKHRTFVLGSDEHYDLMGRDQFDLLRFFGLAPEHYLLDIGCGSLSGGRFAIRYLAAGHYFGLEPERWLIDQGLKYELDSAVVQVKRSAFQHRSDFVLTDFDRKFDYLMAHSILTHTTRSQVAALLNEASKVMLDHSMFFATYRQGPTDYAGDKWSYPVGIVYTLATITRLASERSLHCASLDWPHVKQQTWLIFYRDAGAEFVQNRLHAASLRSVKAVENSRRPRRSLSNET